MEKEEEPQQIIKDISTLLITKDQLDYSKKLTFKDEGKEIDKIVITTGSPDRKVLITDEVRYLIQKYLFNLKTNQFVIFNKDYKNPIKKKIQSMDSNNSIVRKCILQMTESQMTFFIVDKTKEPIYNNIINEFKLDKERQFKKEKKEEAKNKKFEEINSGKIKEDKEINKEEEKFEFEKYYEFDNNVYYRILLIDVMHKLPNDPKNINQYKKFLTEMLDEIRHFIKKKDYNTTESWCNNAISKITSMKKDFKKDWNSNKNLKNKKECMEILKKILLNKVFCLGEKNTNETLDKAIETANLYLDLYKNDLDDQFMKMTGRLVKFKMKKKEWDEAKKNIDIILNYYKDNNNIPDWVKILENEFNNGNVIAKEKKCKKIKKSIQDLYVNEEYFEWRNSLQKKELDEYIFNLNNNLNFRYNYFNKVK